jgi:DNA-binding NtrC family response regulator
MNILIQIRETATDKEIKEFTEGDGNNVFISHSTEESIALLSKYPFDKAVISLKNINDATILKYLNDYHPEIKVVVVANKAFDDILSVFQKVNYSVIHEPLQLSELKTQLLTKLKPA